MKNIYDADFELVTSEAVQCETLTRTGKRVSGLRNHIGELNVCGILFLFFFFLELHSPFNIQINYALRWSASEGRGEACTSARLDKASRAATAGMCRHNDP